MIKSISTYTREELEIEVAALRISLGVARDDFHALKVRSEHVLLDTARAASLESCISSMAHCISRKRYTAANEIASMVLEDTE